MPFDLPWFAPPALLAAASVTGTWAALAARTGRTVTAAGHLVGPALAIAIAAVGVASVDGCGEKMCLFRVFTRIEALRLGVTLLGAAVLAIAGARRHPAILLPSAAVWVAGAGVVNGLASRGAPDLGCVGFGAVALVALAHGLWARRDRAAFGVWFALAALSVASAARVAASCAHEAALHGP